MATQVESRIPAYKTQWNPERDEIQRSTGMSRQVTDLCISYLFSNTLFRSPREFVSYFQENESLEVPAGQPLEIQDISVLDHPGEAPVAWMEKNDQVEMTFSRLLAPLAKVAILVFKERFNLSWKANKWLSCVPLTSFTLKTEKGTVDTRLSDLFRLMVMCEIPRVEFRDNQKLRIWGVTEAEQTRVLANTENIRGLFARTLPRGYKVDYGYPRVLIESMSWEGCRGIGLSSPLLAFSIRDISIRDRYEFSGVPSLIAKLQIGDLVVPPDQQLGVRCRYWSSIPEAALKLQPHGMDMLQAMGALLLAPYGFSLNIYPLEGSTNNKFSLDFVRGEILQISSKTGYRMKLSQEHLFVDFDHLAASMIAERRSVVTISPHQKLMMGVSSEEHAEMSARVSDNERHISRLMRVLLMHSPVGFTWDIAAGQEEGIFSYGTGSYFGIKTCFLQAKGGMELRLARPNGPTMIATIVNHSHPELLRDLQEATPKAFKFLLFRAFYYYLCDDFRVFRSDELPKFFKPEEVRQLVPAENGRMQTEGENPVILVRDGAVCQFIGESTVFKIQKRLRDQDLSQAIAASNRDVACVSKWSEILKMSPDQFDQLTTDSCPAPVKFILLAILELASEEMMGGSPFITTHLQAYLASLDQKD